MECDKKDLKIDKLGFVIFNLLHIKQSALIELPLNIILNHCCSTAMKLIPSKCNAIFTFVNTFLSETRILKKAYYNISKLQLWIFTSKITFKIDHKRKTLLF